ncbi:putative membrane protein YkoI [Rhizobium sp. SG_E_25_P2]|uniref:PepSY domain-containing protein n=1 Tax=Rhizobium sp. SG_E_25_P2 TaxID=2879942 RepID=UPI002476BFBE|nr:PepSY domain-containing protein [Rhizobium sp. SG_E_25_P2]MDH6267026.1 putative membrane protein YkoI [Rhizobium sp. SG_E_25_P2]
MTRFRAQILLASSAIALAMGATTLAANPEETPATPQTPLQHDDARRALQSGLVRPLEDILAEMRKSFPGEVIEIEFEQDDGRYIYEIEMIRPDGRVIEVKMDAKTMAVIAVEDD